jgi:DNA-binding phage protein
MAIQTVRFDIVAELDSEEARLEYVAQVMADGDNEEILRAMAHMAKARDRAQVVRNKDVPGQPIQSQG